MKNLQKARVAEAQKLGMATSQLMRAPGVRRHKNKKRDSQIGRGKRVRLDD